MKKSIKCVLKLILLVIMLFAFTNNVYASQTTEFDCNYVGQNSGKSINIKKVYYDSLLSDMDVNPAATLADFYKYHVTYPSGNTADFYESLPKGNKFPSSKNCDDIFYSANTDRLFAVEKGSYYYIQNINQYCSNYSDLEQYCSGECKIDSVPCGNDKDKTEWGTCPSEILPVIKFLKIVVINTIQIFVPIILILMGTIDFARAVISSDDKAIKDATGRFIKRAITAVMTFFITTIVVIIMNALASADVSGFEDWKACWFYDSNDAE